MQGKDKNSENRSKLAEPSALSSFLLSEPIAQVDLINHPPHYTHSKIEPIDVIEAWKLSYSLGQVIKYVSRHEHKGTKLQDLKKAAWYLAREITNLERDEG